MKKHVLITVLFLFIAEIGTQAQLKFGMKARINLLKVNFNNNVENMIRFQGGPIVEVAIPIIGIGIDAAIQYSQEGFKQDKENILKVPVNLKYKLNFTKMVGTYIAIGPYINLRVSKSDNLKSLEEYYKKKDFGAGLNADVGVELFSHLQVGIIHEIELTKNYSLSDINITVIANELCKEKMTRWLVFTVFLF